MRLNRKPINLIIFSILLLVVHYDNYLIGQNTSFLIGENIAIYYPPDYQKAQHEPSFALLKEPVKIGPIPDSWKMEVIFEQVLSNSIAFIEVEEGTDFYGTGEVTGELKRNGKIRTLWNTDNFGYERNHGLQLYQSHPWVLGVRKNGTAFGVIADNTWKQKILLDNNSITFSSTGPAFRIICIERNNPEEVLKVLANLTGKMPLPPLWSLGYQQCRWSYYPDSRVKEIADTFRIKQIPCDVIWMDIHYMDKYKVFTFSEEDFPDPKGLNDYLHHRGFKSIWMIDPGVKYDKSFWLYQSGTKKDVWVKNSENEDFTGNVWPGACVFPDFTQRKTRQWWADLYLDFMGKGIDGVWNDMNEPAVFGGPGWTMPKDNIHLGDDEIPPAKHERYHNVYGMLMVKASREGIRKANPEKRPFILTRSNFLGGQRYAATWTGDNLATWEHLRMSIPMVLNLGLSGQPFSGPDIGGFGGNASPELYGHWIATGVFYPFSRAHTATGTRFQEPWQFGKEIEKVARTAIERRYRLLPYFYTLFYEASLSGMPVMRPVFFADFKDISLRKEDQAFLLGSDLLIIPKWAKTPSLPGGKWRTISIVGEDSKNDTYQPDIKIREGAIIPLCNIQQNTTHYSIDTLTLLISLDENGSATGKMYFDSGEGFGYLNGDYALLRFSAEKTADKISINTTIDKGRMKISDLHVQVELISDDRTIKTTGTFNKPIIIKLKN
jgi:alpha-glucosidase